jgi:hypothetical protein
MNLLDYVNISPRAYERWHALAQQIVLSADIGSPDAIPDAQCTPCPGGELELYVSLPNGRRPCLRVPRDEWAWRPLQHVTMMTGDVHPSPRSEVGRDAMAVLAPIVRAGGGPIPVLDLHARREPGPAELWVIYTAEGNRRTWRSLRGSGRRGWGTPIVTMAIGASAEEWAVIAEAEAATGRLRSVPEPERPWLGVVLYDPGRWRRRLIADLERCLARAVIEGAP